MFAFPVQIGAISLGAVDFYRREPGPLGRDDLARTLTTVDTIAGALLNADDVPLHTPDGAHGRGPVDGAREGRPGALDGAADLERIGGMVVHRAAGMVMVQLDTSIETALMRLRSAAYAESVSIDDLAADVVHGRRRFEKEKE